MQRSIPRIVRIFWENA